MPVYQVAIDGPKDANGVSSGRGTITVNASDPAAAQENAKQGGNTPVAGTATQVQASPNALTSSINYTHGATGGTSPSSPSSPTGTATNNSNGTYSIATPDGGSISGNGTAPASLVQAVTDYYNALQTGNKAAADEAIRQFNLNYDLTKSSVTGTFDGSPTQAALQQANDIATKQAALTGTYNGKPTLAAEKQASDLAQQNYQQGVTTAGLTGMYSAPSSYQPGTWLTDPSTGAFGQVGANGQVQSYANQAAATAAGYGSQAAPPPVAGSALTPDQKMVIQKQMEGQLGQGGWQNSVFDAALAGGASIQDAVKAGAGGKDVTMPTLPTTAAPPATGATSAAQANWGGAPQQTLAGQQQSFTQGITASGVTGTYQGNETQQALDQRLKNEMANSTMLGFDPTGHATLGEQQLGLDALKATAAMQNDPFRQQQYMQGLSAGGYSRAIDAMNGSTGYAQSQGAQGASAAGTNSMGYLGSVVNGGQQQNPTYSNGQFATPQSQQAYQPQQMQAAQQQQQAAAQAAYQAAMAPYQAQAQGTAAGVGSIDPAQMQAQMAQGQQSAQAAYQSAMAPYQTQAAQQSAGIPATPEAMQAQMAQGQQASQQAYLQAMGQMSPQQAGLGGTSAGSSPMGTGTSTYNANLNALPGSANQIVGRNYLKADKATQNFITSGMSAKTGLDQDTIDEQIKKTMPGFKSPSFGSVNI